MTSLVDLQVEELISEIGARSNLASADRVTRLLHPTSKERAAYQRDLVAIAQHLIERLALEDVVPAAPQGREYRRLLRSRAIEAWVIAWGPSTFLGLHDHGGSNGAFQVASGCIAESSTDLKTRAPLATVYHGAGARQAFGPTHIHEMWNPTEATALSVHVYSPPLSTMNFFAHESPNYLKLLRTETELEWPDADR